MFLSFFLPLFLTLVSGNYKESDEPPMLPGYPMDPFTGVQPYVMGDMEGKKIATTAAKMKLASKDTTPDSDSEVPEYAHYGLCPLARGGLSTIQASPIILKLPGASFDDPGVHAYAVLNASYFSIFHGTNPPRNCREKPFLVRKTEDISEASAVNGDILPSAASMPEGKEACSRILFAKKHKKTLNDILVCSKTREQRRLWIEALKFEVHTYEKLNEAAKNFRYASVSAETLKDEMARMQKLMGSPLAMITGEDHVASPAEFFQYYYPPAPETICAHGGLACLTVPDRIVDPDTGEEVLDMLLRSTMPRWQNSAPIIAVEEQRWALQLDEASGFIRICHRGRPSRCLTAPPVVNATVHIDEDADGGGQVGIYCSGGDYECFDDDSTYIGSSPDEELAAAVSCQEECRGADECKAWTYAGAGRNSTMTENGGRCCLKDINKHGAVDGGLECSKREGFFSGVKNGFHDEIMLVDGAAVDGNPNLGNIALFPPLSTNSEEEATIAGPEALSLWTLNEVSSNSLSTGIVAQIALSRGGRCLTASLPGMTVRQALYGNEKKTGRVTGENGELKGVEAAIAGRSALPKKIVPSEDDKSRGQVVSRDSDAVEKKDRKSNDKEKFELGLPPTATQEEVQEALRKRHEEHQEKMEEQEEADEEVIEDRKTENEDRFLRFQSKRHLRRTKSVPGKRSFSISTESDNAEKTLKDPLDKVVEHSNVLPSRPASPMLFLQTCDDNNPGQSFVFNLPQKMPEI
eukprot:g5893.t1